MPADIVARRFGRSLHNFFSLYAPLSDEWTLFDNSGISQALIVAVQASGQLTVFEEKTWRKLQKQSKTL